MFKELFFLAKMLFKSKPSDYEEVKIDKLDHFPFKGFAWMMWCGVIYCRADEYERRIKQITKQTLNHENIHLSQAKEKGKWCKYYLNYLWEWLKSWPIFPPYDDGPYYTIPYEIEAYANETNLEYKHAPEALKKYNLKHRRKIYREHKYDWKNYIRSL